jgi:hypothetical protein
MLNIPDYCYTGSLTGGPMVHVSCHVCVDRVKINGIAQGLLTGGQSTLAPALECSREAACVCKGTRASW